MMDPKANAIHRMKMKKPSMHPEGIVPDKIDGPKEDEERGEAAPSLKSHASAELGPEHMDLLAKLIAQISHPGRDSMSMDEKANDGMKEKFASISKHKKV
jgi:hypothetical protein